MANGREGSIDLAICEQAIIGAAGVKYFTQNCQSRGRLLVSSSCLMRDRKQGVTQINWNSLWTARKGEA